MRHLFITALAFALPGLVAAHDYQSGSLEILHPFAFETAATAKAGGGYLAIVNSGDSDDALIGVIADFPKVMLHKSEEQDGIMRMLHVDRIEIPAGGTVELSPGGYHVMFMGLTDPFDVEDKIPATLIFENAGEVDVTFNVKARGSETSEHNH